MGEITIGQIWQWFTMIMAGGALLAQAFNAIALGIRKMKSPNLQQDKRINEIESWKDGELRTWQESVEKRLGNDFEHLKKVDESNRVFGLALIALLDHGIAGNNVTQMENAKEELAKHLTSK